MSLELIRKLVGDLPNVAEGAHFDKVSFKTPGGKIFATLEPRQEQLCVKLNLEDQDTFHRLKPVEVYAVPNKWGIQGWTLVQVKAVQTEMLKDLLETAYFTVSKGRS